MCNMPTGKGTYTWPDGSSYEGEVCGGVRHGTGTYRGELDAASYTGQWAQGKRHGQVRPTRPHLSLQSFYSLCARNGFSCCFRVSCITRRTRRHGTKAIG